RSQGRADLPISLRRGLVQGAVLPAAARGQVACGRFGDGDAAKQHVGAAAEAHPLALAGGGRRVAAPHFVHLPAARQHRSADLRVTVVLTFSALSLTVLPTALALCPTA